MAGYWRGVHGSGRQKRQGRRRPGGAGGGGGRERSLDDDFTFLFVVPLQPKRTRIGLGGLSLNSQSYPSYDRSERGLVNKKCPFEDTYLRSTGIQCIALETTQFNRQ